LKRLASFSVQQAAQSCCDAPRRRDVPRRILAGAQLLQRLLPLMRGKLRLPPHLDALSWAIRRAGGDVPRKYLKAGKWM
jgi:hypothetical protein